MQLTLKKVELDKMRSFKKSWWDWFIFFDFSFLLLLVIVIFIWSSCCPNVKQPKLIARKPLPTTTVETTCDLDHQSYATNDQTKLPCGTSFVLGEASY